jgi:hypothetical protein
MDHSVQDGNGGRDSTIVAHHALNIACRLKVLGEGHPFDAEILEITKN